MIPYSECAKWRQRKHKRKWRMRRMDDDRSGVRFPWLWRPFSGFFFVCENTKNKAQWGSRNKTNLGVFFFLVRLWPKHISVRWNVVFAPIFHRTSSLDGWGIYVQRALDGKSYLQDNRKKTPTSIKKKTGMADGDNEMRWAFRNSGGVFEIRDENWLVLQIMTICAVRREVGDAKGVRFGWWFSYTALMLVRLAYIIHFHVIYFARYFWLNEQFGDIYCTIDDFRLRYMYFVWAKKKYFLKILNSKW